MPRFYAIAVHRCEVGGVPTDSLDFRVRALDARSEGEVEERLATEPAQAYRNDDGGEVRWPLVGVMAVNGWDTIQDGDEIVGFIAQAPDVAGWSRPGA